MKIKKQIKIKNNAPILNKRENGAFFCGFGVNNYTKYQFWIIKFNFY